MIMSGFHRLEGARLRRFPSAGCSPGREEYAVAGSHVAKLGGYLDNCAWVAAEMTSAGDHVYLCNLYRDRKIMKSSDAFGKIYVEQVRDCTIASFNGRTISDLLLNESDGFAQATDLVLTQMADVFMMFLTHPNHDFALLDGQRGQKLAHAHSDPDTVRQNLHERVFADASESCIRRLRTPTMAPGRSWWKREMEGDAESIAMMFVAFVVDLVSAHAMPWLQENHFEGEDNGTSCALRTDSAHNDYLDEGGWKDVYSRYPAGIETNTAAFDAVDILTLPADELLAIILESNERLTARWRSELSDPIARGEE